MTTDHPAGGSPTPRPLVVRPARPDDVPAVLALIHELADYERAAHQVRATEESLRAALFAEQPAVFCHVVEVDGVVGGFALWFLNFSTWLGRHGIYLEDLYVRRELRGQGAGTALLRELSAICAQRGYGRLEWWVLDWNADAHGFYRSLGAAPMDEWTVWRLTGDALDRMADGADQAGPASSVAGGLPDGGHDAPRVMPPGQPAG
ncbi:MAG TPA: GNAT family N-acetyltransferase [Candidatus Eisenbacteria bacterium]|nr:GNAT family N-acetyltransferase [Candidatus Eisenbacteria bacterium]